MSARFANDVAIVTGAGSGIGRACALRFAREGAKVVAADISLDGLTATTELARAEGLSLTTLLADVGAAETPKRLVDAAESLGGLSIVVNNAGIGHAHHKSNHDAATTLDEEFDEIISINLRSLFRLSRQAIGVMTPRGHGSIVNIASIYGLTGVPRTTAYGTAKAGVTGMTRQMAADCGPLGIRINAIAPGLIETGMTAQNLRENKNFFDMTVGMVPLGRVGQPEDIAGAAAYLASPDASYVTGHVMVVDGGWLNTRWRRPQQ